MFRETFLGSYSKPQYLTTYFNDISRILELIRTNKTLIIQDCEEAHTLLGSLLLMNQEVKYQKFTDSIQLTANADYLFVIDSNHYIYPHNDLVNDIHTYHLRGK